MKAPRKCPARVCKAFIREMWCGWFLLAYLCQHYDGICDESYDEELLNGKGEDLGVAEENDYFGIVCIYDDGVWLGIVRGYEVVHEAFADIK